MKILYGVQATGNGHITRARQMLPYLIDQGFEVDFIFSGRPKDAYFDMAQFGDFITRHGFTFEYKGDKVSITNTVLKSRPIEFIRDYISLARHLDKYEFVLNDFEPISAWAARRAGVPSVGLSHQYALSYPIADYDFPIGFRAGLKFFAPAKHRLGVHWDSFGYPILPPLISLHSDIETKNDGFTLVYLPIDSLEKLIDVFVQIPEQKFVLYTKINQPYTKANIEIKPLSRETFPIDFAQCDGVISNSGFGLCSEAMVLGKNILTIPLKSHTEQQSNAAVLKLLNRATVVHSLEAEVIRSWIAKPDPPKAVFPNVALEVSRWLKKGDFSTTQKLSDDLWAQTYNVKI
ncbi:glycosyl transferase [Taylorella equigenitalis]|uniref:glycosyltransferase family protein n=1 Tax=Taylorella equigenitalis TaxID=29575 RepID=UPI0003FD5293|nr:glycosyltransferase family protein [Taylorella equigenitalis]WDU48422.1 glycosyl transferase [Taylorella equigenitalis]